MISMQSITKHCAILASLIVLATANSVRGDAADFEEGDYFELDRWFAGGSATLVLPEGGSGFNHIGGATLRAGYYLNEFWAVEAEGTLAENRYAAAAEILWHLWGYERLDPFFTFGFRDWISTDFGPCGGLGSFWHIDDHWSLRFDAGATLGVSDGCDMIYQLSFGIQRSW